jgi:hypothetical protein
MTSRRRGQLKRCIIRTLQLPRSWPRGCTPLVAVAAVIGWQTMRVRAPTLAIDGTGLNEGMLMDVSTSRRVEVFCEQLTMLFETEGLVQNIGLDGTAGDGTPHVISALEARSVTTANVPEFFDDRRSHLRTAKSFTGASSDLLLGCGHCNGDCPLSMLLLHTL